MELKVINRGFNFSQDGPGNRLVYHLQGCDFRCPWCSNPESMSIKPSIIVTEKSDYTCPKNQKVCPENCCYCGECIDDFSSPVRFSCKTYSVGEIIEEIESSTPMFFDGGGVTFTGGEATLQFDSLKYILSEIKKKKIHTALETNGSSPKLSELSELIDFLIIDFKHYDSKKHSDVIGVSNENTVKNIKALSDRQMLIRIPLVNDFNSSENDAEKFADFFKNINNENLSVELLRYHEYGKDKWKQCGLDYKLVNGFVEDEDFGKFRKILIENKIKIVRT